MKKVLLTILSLSLTAFAFWPAGGVKVVETPDVIENPQMVYLNDGSVVIAWHEQKGALTAGHTYCQKLDTTGKVLWDPRGIRVCLHDSLVRDHHMVTDGQDVWFVWQDLRNDDGDIYAQKLSGSTGQRLWDDQGKAVCVKVGLQRRQKGTVLDNESLIASWEDENVEPRNIATQWFNTNGQILWEPNGIYINKGTDRAYTPFVGPSGSSVVFVWRGANEGDTIGANFAQRVDSAGNFLWDTLGVLIEYSSTPYGTCSDGIGGAVVLFGNPGYLGVQRIDSTGQVVWTPGGVKITEFALNQYQTLQLPYPSPDWTGIISDNAGGCFVWQNFYVQLVDSSGSLIWSSVGVPYWISDGVTYRIGATRLCSDGHNGLMVLFDNLEWDNPEWPPYKDQGVRVQRISSEGQTKFDTNGLIIRLWNYDSLPGYESFSQTASAIPGGVIAAWWDNRNAPNYSLYAQIVDTTGKVGSGIDEDEESLLSISVPILEVSTSIASGNISLRYSLPAKGTGAIKLYDVAGKLIKSQNINQLQGVITWSTQELPLGVYFVQLSTLNNERVSRKLLVVR